MNMKRTVWILFAIMLIFFGIGLFSLKYNDEFNFSNTGIPGVYFFDSHDGNVEINDGKIDIKDDDNHVSIGPDGINVIDEDDTVSIGWDGIKVHTPEETVDIGWNGIRVNNRKPKFKIGNFFNFGNWFWFRD